METIESYLDKAAECLAQVLEAPPEIKSALASIAEQYLRLAEYAAKEREVELLRLAAGDLTKDERE